VSILIDVAIARTAKIGTRESGDSVELLERPGGGVSIVVIDGQGSGVAAKTLSQTLLATALNLIKVGVRDGVVVRAVHDQLFTLRHGQVSATIDLVSVDLRTRTVLVTRNATTPLVIGRGADFSLAPCTAEPIGVTMWQRPAIWELAMEVGLSVVACTDGVAGAGTRAGREAFDLAGFAGARYQPEMAAASLADALLDEAIGRDDGRPADDMTVVALHLREHETSPVVRRQSAVIPLP
jgi:serine phosphatase RsbU (regulator of sigma subunit)